VTAKKKSTEPSFEEELAKLEVLAEKMETGELPLDELMAAYEEGVKLSKALTKRLDAAKARLSEVKAGKDGNPEVVSGSPDLQQDEDAQV
jgi:exodeoxyribonuclease VII small subunit